MSDDIHPTNDAETRSDDHQRAIEACEHAADALHDGRLPHAQALLDEAQAAVERAQHDGTEQASRETAYDCYD